MSFTDYLTIHMSKQKQRYLSFLLRLWPVKENDHIVWRVSLESSHTGERWGFATLDALCAFLRQQKVVTLGSKMGERRYEGDKIEL